MSEKSKVFISYANEDKEKAIKLYHDLLNFGADPWIGIKEIKPGENWENAIFRAIKQSDFFIVLLSSISLKKKGFIQKELKFAFDILNEIPEQKTFIIPVRIDDCTIEDTKIKSLQHVDLFQSYDTGLKKILDVLPQSKAHKDFPVSQLTMLIDRNFKDFDEDLNIKKINFHKDIENKQEKIENIIKKSVVPNNVITSSSDHNENKSISGIVTYGISLVLILLLYILLLFFGLTYLSIFSDSIIFIVFGTFSLVASIILFGFLKNSGIVKNSQYQFGGAAALFIVTLSLLFWQYNLKQASALSFRGYVYLNNKVKPNAQVILQEAELRRITNDLGVFEMVLSKNNFRQKYTFIVYCDDINHTFIINHDDLIDVKLNLTMPTNDKSTNSNFEFPKAENNEILIIISQPHDIRRRNNVELNFHRIANDLYHSFVKNFLKNNINNKYKAKLEVLVSEKVEYVNQAESIGNKYNATLIISSKIDTLGIGTSVLLRNPIYRCKFPNKQYSIHGNIIEFNDNDPNETILSEVMIQIRYLVSHSFGVIYYLLEEYKTAISFFQFANTNLLDTIDASPNYLMLGDSYMKKNPNDMKLVYQAISEYEKVLKSKSKQYSYQAYKSIGYCYFAYLNDFDKAIEFYSKAIDNQSFDAELYELRGRAYYNLKKYSFALKDFEDAVALASGNKIFISTIQTLIGNIYNYKSNYDVAAKNYIEAINNNSNDYAAYNLVYIYCKNGDTVLAEKYYNLIINEKLKALCYSLIKQYKGTGEHI